MHAAKKLAKRGSGYFSHEKRSSASGTTGTGGAAEGEEGGGASSSEMAPSMSKDRDSLLHQAVANRSTSRGSAGDAGLGQGQGAAGQEGIAAAGVDKQSECDFLQRLRGQPNDELACHCADHLTFSLILAIPTL